MQQNKEPNPANGKVHLNQGNRSNQEPARNRLFFGPTWLVAGATIPLNFAMTFYLFSAGKKPQVSFLHIYCARRSGNVSNTDLIASHTSVKTKLIYAQRDAICKR